MATNQAPEKGSFTPGSPEHQNALVVAQPQKLEGLLETIDLLERVSERIGEDRSGDLGAAGGTGKSGSAQAGQSARDKAIANLPVPEMMRKQLTKHIEKEVKVLQREVRRAARRISKPGSAYKQNELYAQIRRLNALLAHILEASIEVLERLFIRIFIDKQQAI